MYSFQIKFDKLAPFITLLSRSYPGIFDQFFEINEVEFAKRLKISTNEVTNQLKLLEQYGVIDITWQTSLPTVTFLHERLPDDHLRISEESYKTRKELAFKRLKAAIDYLKIPTCRLSQLLIYFGQEPVKCGKCDVCIGENSPQVSDSELKHQIIRILTTENQTIGSIQGKLNISEERIKQLLHSLLLEEKILDFGTYFGLK